MNPEFLPKSPTVTELVGMELKFLSCCQQMYRTLHADSRGKQDPHLKRVKA